MQIQLILAAVLAAMMGLSQAWATATGGSVNDDGANNDDAFDNGGVFIKLTPPLSNPNGDPNSVGSDNFNDYNLYVFDEEQNVILGSDLAVDDLVGDGRPFDSGTLSAGSTFSSHYVFFDPPQTGSFDTTLMTGCVEFDSAVAAVISSSSNLDDSDYLANTGVNYVSVGQRGLENSDSYSFNGNEVCVDLTTSTPGDYIRVITNFSPVAFEENATCTAIKTRGRRFGVYCF